MDVILIIAGVVFALGMAGVLVELIMNYFADKTIREIRKDEKEKEKEGRYW